MYIINPFNQWANISVHFQISNPWPPGTLVCYHVDALLHQIDSVHVWWSRSHLNCSKLWTTFLDRVCTIGLERESRFLTAHQHKKGHSVPFEVKIKANEIIRWTKGKLNYCSRNAPSKACTPLMNVLSEVYANKQCKQPNMSAVPLERVWWFLNTAILLRNLRCGIFTIGPICLFDNRSCNTYSES